MHTFLSCLALVTSQVLTVPPPAAAVSVGRTHSAFLVVGTVRRPRRPSHHADSSGLHTWIEIPPWMGRAVTWTLYDVNGRNVMTGTADVSEAGPRRLSWDRGDVPAAGLYAVRCIDEYGQYTTASVVIPPN